MSEPQVRSVEAEFVYNVRFRRISQLLLLSAAGGAIYLLLDGRWLDSAVLGGVVLLGIALIAARGRLPPLFATLLIVAALLNTLGYVLTLWHETTAFDEMVHAFTSLAGCAALGWLLIERMAMTTGGPRARILFVFLAIGLVLGLLWETFEWAISIIGSPEDTIIDLLMDLIGAFGAGLLFLSRFGRRRS